jgi:uncharacterized membrane protein
MLIFGFGVLLRVYGLGKESIWIDEAASINFANRNLISIFGHMKWDPHPPLYYILLHFWIGVFGIGEFSIRFLSALFGIFSILVIYKLGKLLFGAENGLYSALLLAVSLFHITFSQEARMYSLLTLLTLISLFFFLKTLKENQRKFMVGYAAASILMIYTHYFGFFILFFQNVFFFTFYRRHKNLVKAQLVVQLIIFLLFIPWLFRFYTTTSIVLEGASSISWIPRPNIVSIVATFFVFSNSSIVCLILFGILSLFRNIDVNKTNGKNLKTSPERGKSFQGKISYDSSFCILWLVFPIILSFIISLLTQPIYQTKYLIIASPAFYILTAEGLNKIKMKKKQMILIGVIILISINALATSYYSVIRKEQWREVAKYIEKNGKQDDLILLSASFTTIPFGYYFNGPNEVRGVRTVVELRDAIDHHIHVWLIISHETHVDPEGLIKKEMDNRYLLKLDRGYVGIKLYYYEAINLLEAGHRNVYDAHPLSM